MGASLVSENASYYYTMKQILKGESSVFEIIEYTLQLSRDAPSTLHALEESENGGFILKTH